MSNFDLKTAPIKFVKHGPGDYRSELFRVYKTVHTGRMWGQAPVRWHCERLDNVEMPHCASPALFLEGWVHGYALSMKDAVETLHRMIGNGFVRAFQVFVDAKKKADAEAARIAAEQASVAVAAKRIEELLTQWLDVHDCDDEIREALARTGGVAALAKFMATPGAKP